MADLVKLYSLVCNEPPHIILRPSSFPGRCDNIGGRWERWACRRDYVLLPVCARIIRLSVHHCQRNWREGGRPWAARRPVVWHRLTGSARKGGGAGSKKACRRVPRFPAADSPRAALGGSWCTTQRHPAELARMQGSVPAKPAAGRLGHDLAYFISGPGARVRAVYTARAFCGFAVFSCLITTRLIDFDCPV